MTLKHKTTATLLGLGLALSSAPTFATTHSAHHGTMCVSNNPKRYSSLMIENPSPTSSLNIDCPVRRTPSDSDQSLKAFYVYYIDNHPWENIVCRLRVHAPDGSVLFSFSVNSADEDGSMGREFSGSLPWTGRQNPMSLDCTIPRVLGGESGVISYLVTEEQ